MCIYRYKVFARFGLMHMLATNVCVWLHTVIMEIVREVRENTDDPGVRDALVRHIPRHQNNRTLTTTVSPTSTLATMLSGNQPAYVIVDEAAAGALSAANTSCMYFPCIMP